MQQHRQLVAILFTDIVGYTAMMQQDEEKAVVLVKKYSSVLKQALTAHRGEILNDYGDGNLCTFPSATEALKAALEIQQQLQSEPSVPLRIGLHSGEIFFEDGKVMGDAINVASRIQSLGQANTILLSAEINNKIKNQPGFSPVSLGHFEFKNVNEPMEVFALTNEGLIVPKRENMEGKLKEANKNIGRKKIIVVVAVLFLLVTGFFLYKQFFDRSNFSDKEKSIAIIPFRMIGTNADNISEGLVEDILVHLSKISELNKVISDKSSSKYADSKKTPAEIGEELQVNSLVMGSIQQIGDTMQINAQLIDTKSGNTLWADNYTRGKQQIFELETELATKIVNALKAKLTPQEKRNLSLHSTENVEAYKFYRKGRYLWDKRTKESFDSAEVNYKHAIDLDPDYALAYSGLADLYIYAQNGLPPLKAMPIARDYALKALSLDSTLGEALTTIGFIQSAFDYDWAKSKNILEKAIALNPNYTMAHVYYGNLLQFTGENTGRGIKEVKKALELDPLSPSINWILGRNYYLAKQYDLAYEQLKKTLILGPNYTLAKGTLIYVALERKKFDEAMQLINQLKVKDLWDYQGPYLCYYYAVAGDTMRAKNELMKTIKEYPDQSSYHLARCNVVLKNFSVALDELEQAYLQKDIRIYNYLKTDPILDPIRKEPRFIALLKKTGLE